MHSFLESLLTRFPQAVLTAQQDPVRLDLWAQVSAHSWREIAQFLHDDSSLVLDHIVVMLRVVAGLDVAVVAELVGKKPGAVRVAVHRALKSLSRDPRARAAREVV